MKNFQDLFESAEAINQTPLVEKVTALVERLNKQEFTNVVVTGARNCGKTTFINEIIGCEVWEPGAFDENEKPLRISFEPVQDDARYNCLMAASLPWHDLRAIIYEVRNEQLFVNPPSEDLLFADAVFYIISALSPFGKEDVDALKSPMPFKRQVIVSNIDLVEERNRERVLNYIDKINGSLNLPPVITLDGKKNFGKRIRDIVPAFDELQELRARKCRRLLDDMLDTLEDVTRREIAAWEDSARVDRLNLKNDGLRNGCQTLRTDVEKYKKSAIETVTDDLSSRRESLVNEILQTAAASTSGEEIQAAAEKKYRELSSAAIESLQKNFLANLKSIDSSARLLAIPHWQEDTFEQLAEFSPQKILAQISPKKLTVRPAQSIDVDKKLLVGTGIVAGGLALVPTLAPLPPIVGVAGTVAALGYGLASYMNNRSRQKQAAVDAVDATVRQALGNINDFVREIAAISYDKISEQILLGEETLPAPTPAKNESRVEQLRCIMNSFKRQREHSADDESSPTKESAQE